MTNPYSIFKTNTNLESGAGITLQYPGFSITIHRAGGSNKKFATILAQKLKPHRQAFERGLLDDETSERIVLEAYAESIVVGWDNVKDEKGKLIKFSVENVKKLFSDLPELFADVKAQAANASLFRQEQEKTDIKN